MNDFFVLTVNVALFTALISIFLLSSLHKLKQQEKFHEAILSFQMVPLKAAKFASRSIPWVELSAVFLSVYSALTFSSQYTVWPLLLMLMGYSVVLLSVKVRKLELNDCGCSFAQSTTVVSIGFLLVRNTLLIIAGLVVCFSAVNLTQASLVMWVLGLLFSGFLVLMYFSLDLLINNYSSLKTLQVKND